jgi:hypothetical protein
MNPGECGSQSLLVPASRKVIIGHLHCFGGLWTGASFQHAGDFHFDQPQCRGILQGTDFQYIIDKTKLIRTRPNYIYWQTIKQTGRQKLCIAKFFFIQNFFFKNFGNFFWKTKGGTIAFFRKKQRGEYQFFLNFCFGKKGALFRKKNFEKAKGGPLLFSEKTKGGVLLFFWIFFV